jgi:hypothetical protein
VVIIQPTRVSVRLVVSAPVCGQSGPSLSTETSVGDGQGRAGGHHRGGDGDGAGDQRAPQ